MAVPNYPSGPLQPLKLIYFSIGVVYGKPAPADYPAPTPSAAPAVLANFPAPAPQIAPSLLIENVPYSGQFGIPPVLRIDGKPQGFALTQPQFSSPFGNLGFSFAQPQFTFAQPGFGYAPQGYNFGQPGYNFAQPNFYYGQPGYNFGQSYNFPQPGYNFAQPGSSFDGLYANAGAPQADPNARPPPDLGPTNAAPTRPTPTVGEVSAPQFKPIPSVSSIGISEKIKVETSAGGATVHKHIYVHVPPPEPEVEQRPRIIVPPPQKHVRVIFIKAGPSSPPKPKIPVVVPIPRQHEEKTVVFILARRPEVPEIKFEAPVTTLPPKPKVYFIRYDALKKAGADAAAGTPTSGGAPNDGVPDEEAPATENPVFKIDTRINTDADGFDDKIVSSVTLNLNEASLTGGSALSQAVTGSPDHNAVLVSTTPETGYETQSDRK